VGVYCAALVACMSAVQPLSLSLFIPRSPSRAEWYGVYRSEHMWISSANGTRWTKPSISSVPNNTITLVLSYISKQKHTHTHALIHSHVVFLFLSTTTQAHLAAGSLGRKKNSRDLSFLTISVMFSFRLSRLNGAF